MEPLRLVTKEEVEAERHAPPHRVGHLVGESGLRLLVDCPPLAEPVFIDREMWEKIILNLLSNAFKFTFEGEIAVRLRRVDATAELIVADTGIGIAEHELPRLFERFHRVRGAEGGHGAGLGDDRDSP